MEDLATHTSSWPEAIKTTYRVFMSMSARLAGSSLFLLLKLLKALSSEVWPWLRRFAASPDRGNAIAFADARRFITDPALPPPRAVQVHARIYFPRSTQNATPCRFQPHGPLQMCAMAAFCVDRYCQLSGCRCIRQRSIDGELQLHRIWISIVPRGCGFSAKPRGKFSLDATHQTASHRGRGRTIRSYLASHYILVLNRLCFARSHAWEDSCSHKDTFS